ncbi:MAG: hypothetical protein AAGH15_01835 [Myxococcota bacterium]
MSAAAKQELEAAQRRMLAALRAGAEPTPGWVVQRRNVIFGMLARLRREYPFTCAALGEGNQKYLAREVVAELPRPRDLPACVLRILERERMPADTPGLRVAYRADRLLARARSAWWRARLDPSRFVP